MFLLALVAISTLQPKSGQTCAVDSNFFGQSFETFDQDPDKGWRRVASIPGCDLAAAELIRRYRIALDSRARLLRFHEAQSRAFAGETRCAIRLFSGTKAEVDDAVPDFIGWNVYVDATISFLEHDRRGLMRARARLAVWPRPATKDFDPGSEPWPLNLNIVDQLIRCFGRPYRIAYAACPDHQRKGPI